ncbi:glycoside hydrolase family 30 beta sandwich domain-containing protein [Fodinicola feengrottensis]|nr:glycoside hydrolase family 30 beta sandwich domain-containing protein [Fodinicola feengrottensis]
MTECEGGDNSTITAVMQNWGSASIDWNIALDQNHGPHVGGCGTCNGTITVNSDTKQVTYNDQYRDIAHFSKFVPKGAVRIASTVRDTTGATQVDTVAFTNPDRSTVLVASNPGTTAKTFTVMCDGRSFDATLAPGAVATYHWH